MQRVTISIDEALAETFDALLRERAYQSRSEGVRDLVRDAVERWRAERRDSAHCVANLSYIYSRRTRALAERLSEMQHANHDLIVSTTQVRLDHEHSLESVLLRGPTVKVRQFADEVRAERGVRFDSINVVAVEANDDHRGSNDHSHTGHAHLQPRQG
jgi:CopG family nickel-responsive transcriptional regulator